MDVEGRTFELEQVVVNFANVGTFFGKKVMGKPGQTGLFDWEGVRRCCTYLKQEKGWKVVGVINENFAGTDLKTGRRNEKMPEDISRMCESIEETPRINSYNHQSADDEMTIKCAYRRNCRFIDNDNYRDWNKNLGDDKIRTWFNKYQQLLQTRYFFDKGVGTFDILEGNYPAELLATGTQVDKKELW